MLTIKLLTIKIFNANYFNIYFSVFTNYIVILNTKMFLKGAQNDSEPDNITLNSFIFWVQKC